MPDWQHDRGERRVASIREETAETKAADKRRIAAIRKEAAERKAADERRAAMELRKTIGGVPDAMDMRLSKGKGKELDADIKRAEAEIPPSEPDVKAKYRAVVMPDKSACDRAKLERARNRQDTRRRTLETRHSWLSVWHKQEQPHIDPQVVERVETLSGYAKKREAAIALAKPDYTKLSEEQKAMKQYELDRQRNEWARTATKESRMPAELVSKGPLEPESDSESDEDDGGHPEFQLIFDALDEPIP